MKKNIWLLLFITILQTGVSFGQSIDSTTSIAAPKIYKVAVFAPMYLDSVFSNTSFNTSNTLPRFIMPAVEFVQGAQIAFDTLSLNGKKAEAFIYDSKSVARPITWLVQNKLLDSMDLIIGSVKDPDYQELANFAVEKHIPFVSATYPNDGGITQNPYLIIVNSTLKAHCEGILSYLVQKHGTDKIYLVKKKGDDRIENYFKDANMEDGKPLINIKTITLDSSISSYTLSRRIDTTDAIVIIGASLNETFAKKLADACYPIQKNNPLVLIGMPNWDGFRSFAKKDAYPDFPILYTTPHYNSKNTVYDSLIVQKYFQLYRAKPSDMAYKGFQTAYFFTNLLLNNSSDFMSHINDTQYMVFHNYNFLPVHVGANSDTPDYFENSHLFIMQILNGEIDRAW
ncbi:MAG: ABC transporter substrate-binding protein [Ginsengibacter sp.]